MGSFPCKAEAWKSSLGRVHSGGKVCREKVQATVASPSHMAAPPLLRDSGVSSVDVIGCPLSRPRIHDHHCCRLSFRRKLLSSITTYSLPILIAITILELLSCPQNIEAVHRRKEPSEATLILLLHPSQPFHASILSLRQRQCQVGLLRTSHTRKYD